MSLTCIHPFIPSTLSSLSRLLSIQYGVDQTRFFLMSEVGFGSDGDFSDKAMILKVNTNLANELGNLCQRVLTMVFKNCNKAVPSIDPATDFTPEDQALLASAQGLFDRASPSIVKDQAIQKYTHELIEMVWAANKYIDDMAPWVLRKEDPERMAVVLYVLMEVLRYVSILYQPIIPTSANKILDLLTVPEEERTFAHLNSEYRIKAGSPIEKPEGVFPRIDLPELVEA
jgi:methionyl-tRNA synthetase